MDFASLFVRCPAEHEITHNRTIVPLNAVASDDTTKPARPPSEIETGGATGPVAPGGRLERGTSLGRYTVLSTLGSGGNGIVYLAHDPELDRKVAIKVLSAGCSGSEMLLHEARVAGSMAHPNVVRVYDVGDFGSEVFIAMEYLDGRTLDRWLTEERPEPPEILEAFSRAGHGLSAAHRAGLVHGDFKPHNVMVTEDGRVVVLDFGLGRVIDPEGSEQTESTELVGTPVYMAPELYAGETSTPASDQFAFCVALYEALVGQRPFAVTELRSGTIDVPPARRSIPRRVRSAIHRGLSVDPSARFDSMDALLRELAPGRSVLRRIGFIGVVAGVLGTTWATSSQGDEPICEPTRSPMHAVWNDEAQAALAELGDAGSAEALRATIDDFTARWNDQWLDACTARHVEHSESPALFDRRTLCLDRGRASIAAVLEEVRASDAAAPRAALVVSQLPSPEGCGDTEALLSTTALPTDPRERAALTRLEQDVARAQTMARFSSQRDAIEEMLPALFDRGRALSSDRTIARIHFAEATAMLDEERYAEADAAYRRAAHHAELAHDDVYAAYVATYLVYLEGLRGHAAQAGIWADYGWAKLARVPSAQHELRLALMASEAVVARHAGDDELAIARLEEALAIHAELSRTDDVVKGDMLASLASAYRVAGRRDEARQVGERALEIRRATLGPRHPLVGESLYNLALLHLDAGEIDEARQRLEDSRALLDHDRTGARRALAIANLLGAILAERGDVAEAERALRTGIAEARERIPGVAYELNPPMINLGRLLLMDKRPEEARDLLREAIEIAEATRGRDYAPLQGDYELLANASVAAGHAEQATDALLRARSLATAPEDLARLHALIESINETPPKAPPP